MSTERTSVGLDVHARSVAAAAMDGGTGELVQAKLTPSHEHIRSWIADLTGPVAVAYEAGPTGLGLSRSLNTSGIRCEVVAPSKLQRPSGDRVKTDARDAVHLARLLRLDEFTAVAVPTVEQEASRDLVRAREDARGDLMRARHRLSKLLLRQGFVYSGGQAWTGKHDVWLRRVGREELSAAATRATFESDYDAVLTIKARRDRLDVLIEQMAAGCEFTAVVHRLGCLRGVGILTGFALAVEIGDWDRFTGKTIGPFVGLVPSEYSSGQSRVQGAITKTGNTHLRRLLVEAAWHHRSTYRVGKTMRDRWELAGPAARARGDEGNRRLHYRWNTMRARNKKHTVTNIAIARELAGWSGPWPCSRSRPSPVCFVDPSGGSSARSDPRCSYEQPFIEGRRSLLDTRPLQPNSPSCGNQPAHISLTARRETRSATTKDDEARGARPGQPGRAPHPAH
ncbi:MAG: IS110 family transposase [Nocardioidaceae bacterium]